MKKKSETKRKTVISLVIGVILGISVVTIAFNALNG